MTEAGLPRPPVARARWRSAAAAAAVRWRRLTVARARQRSVAAAVRWRRLTVARARQRSEAGAAGSRRGWGDEGSAVVEFVTLGMLLLMPLVYLVVAMGRVQAATFAVDGSAREAARAFVASGDEEEGRRRALAAVRLGLLDQGFDQAAETALVLDCAADPCLEPGERVTATVQVQVALPGIPAFVDRAIPARITVRSAQVATVDRFRPASP